MDYMCTRYVVASLNRATPIQTPNYCNLQYGDPKKVTPSFGKVPYKVFKIYRSPLES